MCNEYIINVRTCSGNELYRIYHHNETLALKLFIGACERYSKTGKEDAKSYWRELIFSVENDRYTIMRNFDFVGISKIV